MPKPFPMNAWYAAGLGRRDQARAVAAHDLRQARRACTARTDGEVAALEDACWHRLLPLSKGRLEGDDAGLRLSRPDIQLVMAAARFMPSQETINPSACVRAYPVVERHRFVWLWTGDPALADPALVPDMHWNDDPDWAGDGKTIHVKCDYRLVVDNLMDLDARDLRARLAASATTRSPRRRSTSTHGDTHRDRRRAGCEDIDAPPFWAEPACSKPGTVDRWQIIRFEAPCTVDYRRRRARPPAPARRRATAPQGVNGYVLNTITPETDNDLPLLLGLRAQLPPDRAAPDHGAARRRQPAFSARTRSSSKRSSARWTNTPTASSTTSTSMPARCGRGALIDRMVATGKRRRSVQAAE